jgi:hypothetical protein
MMHSQKNIKKYAKNLENFCEEFSPFLNNQCSVHSLYTTRCSQSVHNSHLPFPQCINSHLSNALTCSCYEFGAMAL